jgi:O-antigen ligase/Flp pilus assembly protein TadD
MAKKHSTRSAGSTATRPRPATRPAGNQNRDRAVGGGKTRAAGANRRPTDRRRTEPERAAAATPWGWGLAVLAFLLPTLLFFTVTTRTDVPKTAVLWVLTGAGLPFLVALALGKGPARGSLSRTWAARSAIAFVLVAVIATVTSKAPLHSLVGSYTTMTGLIFFAGLAACWALGTGVSAADRRLVESGIIWAGALNALVAFFQRFVDLSGIGLGMYGGVQPDGLLGNPVFLGGLLAATLALLATRVVERPSLWAPVTALVGFGAAISGERFPILVAVGVVAWSIWALNRRDDAGLRNRVTRQRAITYGMASGGALILGAIIPGATSASNVVGHVASSTTAETFGERTGSWLAGFHALLDRPLFGYGPEQYQPATVPHYSLALSRTLGQAYFGDAHNIIVEVAVVTGVLGLITLGAWVLFAARDRGGPLMAFAIALVAGELVEPLMVGITALAFLALGAAPVRARAGVAKEPGPADGRRKASQEQGRSTTLGASPRWARATSLSLAGIAAVAGILLIVGDAAQRGDTQPRPATASAAVADGKTANSLLQAWPTPAATLAYAFFLTGTPGHSNAAEAAHYASEAVQRDPTTSTYWYELAALQFAAGDTAGARASAHRAITANPRFVEPMNLLAEIAGLRGDRSAERTYLERSLLYDPKQKIEQMFLSGQCYPRVKSTRFGARAISARCTRR